MVSALEIKKKKVLEISEKLKRAKVVAVIDLHSLPNALLHQIRKELKSEAEIIIYKTSLLRRALRMAKLDSLLPVMKGEKALLITNVDPFKLYKKMNSNPLKVYAKPGQIAPYDIVVPAGETQLPPGPILTELKSAGIDARVQGGKVAIGKDSVVAKKGEVIKDVVAKALQKLDIKPFEIRVRVPLAWEGGITYTEELLNVDEKKILSDLVSAYHNARAISIEIGYVTKEVIEPLIQKAYRNARYIGIEREIMLPELMEELMKKAARQAHALDSAVSKAA
ncbi:MAG: 50S ribosomal protein L10 [Candidatus Micrarchaeota archaeon]|nr:50S ribosomal protein L10 [Candidatus Micrarchaeota archaeon]